MQQRDESRIFVVHEHHARHLHFDLRLEKEWLLIKKKDDFADKDFRLQTVLHRPS